MDRIVVTGFAWAPPFAQGLVRDIRVRWALEEAGLPYDVNLIAFGDRESPTYRARQPFGMVPAFEADGHGLFESGAIVHRIAEDCEALMPTDREGRGETVTWMFAALNTIEPVVQNLTAIDFQHGNEEWARLRRPAAVEQVVARLHVLAERLEGRHYLLDRFTAADILMATVLRLLRHTDIVSSIPTLAGYLARCEARPAFQRALNAQLSDFERNAPLAA